MNRSSFHGRLGLFIVICLWLAGCSGLAYQHMNDPSRDVWQQPEVQREMESAGYRLMADFDVIDRQHFQIFSRNGAGT